MLIRITTDHQDVEGLRPVIEKLADLFAETVLSKLKVAEQHPPKHTGEILSLGSPPSTPRLVSVDELATAVGQSKHSLYRMAKMGRIPSYAAGPNLKGRRFDVEEVRRVLRQEVLNHAGQ